MINLNDPELIEKEFSMNDEFRNKLECEIKNAELKINEVKEVISKKDNSPMIIVEFAVIEPLEFIGKKITGFYPLTPELKWKLRRLCIACGLYILENYTLRNGEQRETKYVSQIDFSNDLLGKIIRADCEKYNDKIQVNNEREIAENPNFFKDLKN